MLSNIPHPGLKLKYLPEETTVKFSLVSGIKVLAYLRKSRECFSNRFSVLSCKIVTLREPAWDLLSAVVWLKHTVAGCGWSLNLEPGRPFCLLYRRLIWGVLSPGDMILY